MARARIECARATLVDILRWRATHETNRCAYTELIDGETTEANWTYGDIDRRACRIGEMLCARLPAGSRVLLLYPTSLEYIGALFGCFYAGMVAVPLYPPPRRRRDERLAAVAADADASLILTMSSVSEEVAQWQIQHQCAIETVCTDALERDEHVTWEPVLSNAHTLALLQYTSGSTATPKGVMITHHNLITNVSIICRDMGHTAETIAVSWLPFFHDLGLVGKIIHAAYGGFRCIFFSPAQFMQRPWRWLRAISAYGATTSFAPNFAYDLCVRAITPEQRTTLRLDSWRVAVNGGEPIRASTIEQFTEIFRSCGFHASAWYPGYGLAESTLGVAGGCQSFPTILDLDATALERGEAQVTTESAMPVRRLVASGRIYPHQQLLIVDPETNDSCATEEIGEIWLQSDSVASGYWNAPDATNETFGAHTSNGEGPFLRTGDLGFVRAGELFIAGRLKDLIIIDGRNHYPQDIEHTIEMCHDAIRPTGVAAISIERHDSERLVILVEVMNSHIVADVIAAIRAAVAEQHELDVYDCVCVKPRILPKTSSGKIRRRACREAYESGALAQIPRETVAFAITIRDALPGERLRLLEAYFEQMLVDVLPPATMTPLRTHPLLQIGLDSLMLMRLRNRVEGDLGYALSLAHIFNGATITDLAQLVAEHYATYDLLLQMKRNRREESRDEEYVVL